MEIYICLIVFILLFSAIVKMSVPNEKKGEQIILTVSMIIIFFLLALKKETVGIDIAGYKLQYELSKFEDWGSFDFIYFEVGYTALMMLFAKIGLDFQIFAAFLYIIFCSAMYLLISKYSKNVTMSLLIFICYQFFVFSVSGLRQVLAMSICIFSFLICNRGSLISTAISISLVILATMFHESAIVFLVVPVMLITTKETVNINFWCAICVLAFFFRAVAWKFITSWYGRTITEFELGGSFLFLVGIAIFLAYTYARSNNSQDVKVSQKLLKEKFNADAFGVKVAFMAVICYIIFSGGTMLRANMYYTMLLIPYIPAGIFRYDKKSRVILNVALGIFLIILFYKDTLAPNQLELCPYKFFWQ